MITRFFKQILIILLLWWQFTTPVWAFCGFFVAKADNPLHNASSKVIIAHSGDRSVFMMANDFQGDVAEFARIVPIPVIPTRENVRIGSNEIIEQLNTYTSPRLAQYLDDPCQDERNFLLKILVFGIFAGIGYLIYLRQWRILEIVIVLLIIIILSLMALPSFLSQANKGTQFYQSPSSVTVEDQFTLGEYDIVILSAKESKDLVTWLQQNEYKIPNNAQKMLQNYINEDMKFFVVKVNLENFNKQGFSYLRPIVLDYQSPKFMLPIRLGTLNATTDQDLTIFLISPNSFIETENYRTVTIPTDAKSTQNKLSGLELPEFLEDNFGEFYAAVFDKEHEKQGKNAVFLEYASYLLGGNVGDLSKVSPNIPLFGQKCDPCTMPPESLNKFLGNISETGAFWEYPQNSYITRLHLRYNAQTFPQDLYFKEIKPEILTQKIEQEGKLFPNRAGVVFQGRYVIRKTIDNSCWSAKFYQKRKERYIFQNLHQLTGWDLESIKQKAQSSKIVN